MKRSNEFGSAIIWLIISPPVAGRSLDGVVDVDAKAVVGVELFLNEEDTSLLISFPDFERGVVQIVPAILSAPWFILLAVLHEETDVVDELGARQAVGEEILKGYHAHSVPVRVNFFFHISYIHGGNSPLISSSSSNAPL
jgi:hypothetical protein